MRRGFTFIELMSVFAIIAILAAILFPVFARAREKARQCNCLGNLQNIGAALRMYAADHHGHLPPTDNDLSPLFPKVLSDPSVLLCPTESGLRPPLQPAPANEELTSDYLYRSGLQDDWAPGQIVAGDLQPDLHNGGANYLFLDGHAKWLTHGSYSGRDLSEIEGYDQIEQMREERLPEEPADEEPLEPGMEG